MSLAEELLADLDAAPDEDVRSGNSVLDSQDGSVSTPIDVRSVRYIARLRDSHKFNDLMKAIDQQMSTERPDLSSPIVESRPVERDVEYETIVLANNTAAEIDNEINLIHKYVRDLYGMRFPELESLVPSQLDFLRTVQILGNEIVERAKSNEELPTFLTAATIMVISVSASTTQGHELGARELALVLEACQLALELRAAKQRILDYVASRMTLIAPNLSMLLGAQLAAKLIGVAGSLANLAKMPACNIALLGQESRSLTGFSSTGAPTLPHTGLVFTADLVQRAHPDQQRRASRLVASKCTLAARVDAFHEAQDGHVGLELLSQVESIVGRWNEPPPVKLVKPLAAPGEAPRKKRGGRRHRKMKARLGISELRKAKGRMLFGEIEEDAYQSDLGFSLGALGKSGRSSALRVPQADAKTKAKVSKSLQEKLRKQQSTWGGSTTVRRAISGTASVVFTPLQGLEIANPESGAGAAGRSGGEAARRVDEANKRWFDGTSTFLRVGSASSRPAAFSSASSSALP